MTAASAASGVFRPRPKRGNFKAKLEQKEGRFFPERYQHGGYDLVADFLLAHAARRTHRRDQRSEKQFRAWWTSHFNEKRLNAVPPEALEQARRQLLTQGSDPSADPPRPCTPQRVNRYVSWLRHALNVAILDGKLSNNPVRKLAMYREPSGSTRYLTMKEEETVCAAIGPAHSPWIRFAILTGLRRSEQFTLRWADVDLVHGFLTLPRTKADHVQHVPLNAEAKHLLEWLHAVAEAQLEGVTWHTLRHTFASRLAMSGVTEYDIASCLRHAGTTLVRRYARLSPTHLRSVVERASSYGKVASLPLETIISVQST